MQRSEIEAYPKLATGHFAAFAATACLVMTLSAPAVAVDDKPKPTETCPSGQVFDEESAKCVDQESGLVDDDALTNYAANLSREGRYEDALAVLDRLRDQNTAVALNYRGYATRKLGRIDEGIGYYLKSVSIDPDYTSVREYLGEAYLTQGKLDLARDQLAEIEKRCGTNCEPYHALAEAIAAAQS